MDEIRELRKEAEIARTLDAGSLARQIAGTGFRCKRCGKCCRSEFGDNTVTVFPSEIREIMVSTGLEWLDIARPHESDDVDEHGRYHTFEWALKKKKNGDCAFLEDGGCAIYEQRPLICRTYPMSIDAGRPDIVLYECDGIGSGAMGDAEAGRMAEALLRRRHTEAAEAIALLEKYEAFRPAPHAPGRDRTHAVHDREYVVHDSEGSHRVRERKDGSFSFA